MNFQKIINFNSVRMKSRNSDYLLQINQKILNKLEKNFENKVISISINGIELLKLKKQEIFVSIFNNLIKKIKQINKIDFINIDSKLPESLISNKIKDSNDLIVQIQKIFQSIQQSYYIFITITFFGQPDNEEKFLEELNFLQELYDLFKNYEIGSFNLLFSDK